MSFNKKRFYLFFFLLSVCALILFSLCSAVREQRTCAAIPILTEREYGRLKGGASFDASAFLMQNDHPVARDIKTDTIYISIHPSDDLLPWNLSARLSSSHPEYSLCFAPDPAFEDFKKAVSENHVFTLLVVRDNRFVPYSVIFTTLPVLELSVFKPTERHDIHRGRFTLWDARSSESAYSIASSEAEWHIRGASTGGTAKPPYKINIKKDGTAENRNLSLLDLGRDDDWILNSMVFDDLNIREMLVTSFWNGLQNSTGFSPKTTVSQYVEVLMNGAYSGLYLLQRRIDGKYLGLNEAESILARGNLASPIDSAETRFSIEANPSSIPESEVYDLIRPIHQAISSGSDLTSMPNINVKNWIDFNIMTSAFVCIDNLSYNNTFLAFRKQDGQYTIEYIPWDMDKTFGFTSNNGNVVDFDLMHRSTPLLRAESTAFFRLDPSLKQKLAQRWIELRSNVLHPDQLTSSILSFHNALSESGSLIRDQSKWGLYHDGNDTLESLFHHLSIHLSLMDTYYQSLLRKDAPPSQSN